jgi:hypothetical protein
VRQGQQNRRGRGRNRKSQNPLARSFESNGPDVKVRGTPAHIAEKYLSLARDAQSAGDPVLAENYFQHAEHYSRIIMAYRDQLQPHGDQPNGNGQRVRQEGFESDEFGDEEEEDILDEGLQPSFTPHPHHPHGGSPPHQPSRQPYEGHRHDRPHRHGRFRDRYGDRGDRGDRGERPGGEHRSEGRLPERQPERFSDSGPETGEPRRRDRFQPGGSDQPDFLRRPVRRVRSDNDGTPGKDDPTRE